MRLDPSAGRPPALPERRTRRLGVDDRIIRAAETAERRLARAEEWLTILNETWEGSGITQDYSHKGDFYDIEGLRIYPALEKRPEIFLSGMTDEAIRLSGMFADIHTCCGPRSPRTHGATSSASGTSARRTGVGSASLCGCT
ncbi:MULTISPECIES: LLM class flavin-dependent oxidoreductase [unclassified Streptomyces]|uniref:LLM class flavin-dependent oxidoreductase n=1 Tax=unclassified Streptomyces TaxID=2593676 RepID=UPI002E2BB273|nr:LLM class flavin-dependent oxidoreductase [Streptomyces sp. NBC_01439]